VRRIAVVCFARALAALASRPLATDSTRRYRALPARAGVFRRQRRDQARLDAAIRELTELARVRLRKDGVTSRLGGLPDSTGIA
jgi:hypothetical protein